MGEKYFNRRCQGTIRINQRRFEILLADTYHIQFAYTDRNKKEEKHKGELFAKQHDSHRSICSWLRKKGN